MQDLIRSRVQSELGEFFISFVTFLIDRNSKMTGSNVPKNTSTNANIIITPINKPSFVVLYTYSITKEGVSVRISKLKIFTVIRLHRCIL